MDIKTIINNHTAALGGKERLSAVRSMRFNGSIVEPKLTIENFNVIRMKPYFQKVWLAVGDGIFSEGYNGDYAWEKIETILSDFRDVDGIMVAIHETQRDRITGELLSQLTWRTVEINPALTEKDFEMP